MKIVTAVAVYVLAATPTTLAFAPGSTARSTATRLFNDKAPKHDVGNNSMGKL